MTRCQDAVVTCPAASAPNPSCRFSSACSAGEHIHAEYTMRTDDETDRTVGASQSPIQF
jgi:hypothetical protein